MSFLFAQPEMLGAAATDLASIGSAISTANAAAAAATTRVLAAGADEVSAAVAALFSGHAQTYQALSTQAAAFHQQIVQTLTSTAGAYASAEAANVEQQLLGAINAPTMALLGRPVNAITDQRAPQPQLCGRVDRTQHLLLQRLQR